MSYEYQNPIADVEARARAQWQKSNALRSWGDNRAKEVWLIWADSLITQEEWAESPQEVTVFEAYLGWSNPDCGPAEKRLYAVDDEGTSLRWAKPRAIVIEDLLIEAGIQEGSRVTVTVTGTR